MMKQNKKDWLMEQDELNHLAIVKANIEEAAKK